MRALLQRCQRILTMLQNFSPAAVSFSERVLRTNKGTCKYNSSRFSAAEAAAGVKSNKRAAALILPLCTICRKSFKSLTCQHFQIIIEKEVIF